MKTKSLSLKISPSIGTVSAECIIPENSHCIITLAHGAGAGMNHSFMVTLAQLLSEQGIATLRFNFPFAENKKGRPDTPAVAHATIASAIANAEKLFPELPLFCSRKIIWWPNDFSILISTSRCSSKRNNLLWLPVTSAG